MITVGKAAKMFGLSRTTLLYYDSIGILSPSERGSNRYRFYSESDIAKLKQIVGLRDVGVPLGEILRHLETSETEVASLLLKRLNEMNVEIENIRKQQEVIIKLLGNNDLKSKRTSMDGEGWLSILKNAGINADTAIEWHAYFEKNSPRQHEKFLSALGFTGEEIQKIRAGLSFDQELSKPGS